MRAAGALALALLTLLGVAAGQPTSSQDAPSDAFLDGQLLIQYEVLTKDLLQQPITGSGGADEALRACGTDGQGSIRIDTERDFTFIDTSNEKGCMEAKFRVPVPAGAGQVRLNFAWDRTVLQPQDPLPGALFPVDLIQEVRIYHNEQVDPRLQDKPLKDSTVLYSNTTQHEMVDVLNAEDHDITVGWQFRDVSQTPNIAGDKVMQQTLVTVTNATVTFTGLPPEHPVRVEERRSAEGSGRTRQTLTGIVQLDPPKAGKLGVAVRVDDKFDLVEITSKLGTPIPARSISFDADKKLKIVELDPDAAARHNYGEFRFTFTAAVPLQSNAAMLLLIIAMILLPGVMAGLSIRQWVHLRRQAGSSYPHVAQQYLWAILAAQGTYLIVLAWIVITQPFPLIVAWPMESQTVLLLGILLACTAAFFGLAFLAKGRLVRLAESDLAAKRRANLELQRSNRDLEQFAYVASHDLQEPLRAVAGYTQLLQHRYGERLDPQARQYIRNAVEGADRMQGLIHGLLAYARIGTDTSNLGAVDLAVALGEALGNLEVPLKESKGHVTHGRLPTVHADRAQVVQLLQNLVGNALKFHAAGRAPRIHVEARETGIGEWTVEVRDNGIGIPTEHQQRIFQIFQRLHPRDRYPGSGLGLAICQRIVERHGGRIWVESRPGQGSRFLFTMAKAPPSGRTASG